MQRRPPQQAKILPNKIRKELFVKGIKNRLIKDIEADYTNDSFWSNRQELFFLYYDEPFSENDIRDAPEKIVANEINNFIIILLAASFFLTINSLFMFESGLILPFIPISLFVLHIFYLNRKLFVDAKGISLTFLGKRTKEITWDKIAFAYYEIESSSMKKNSIQKTLDFKLKILTKSNKVVVFPGLYSSSKRDIGACIQKHLIEHEIISEFD